LSVRRWRKWFVNSKGRSFFVTTTAIRTDGLSKRYGDVEVLTDLALEVSTGRPTQPGPRS